MDAEKFLGAGQEALARGNRQSQAKSGGHYYRRTGSQEDARGCRRETTTPWGGKRPPKGDDGNWKGEVTISR